MYVEYSTACATSASGVYLQFRWQRARRAQERRAHFTPAPKLQGAACGRVRRCTAAGDIAVGLCGRRHGGRARGGRAPLPALSSLARQRAPPCRYRATACQFCGQRRGPNSLASAAGLGEPWSRSPRGRACAFPTLFAVGGARDEGRGSPRATSPSHTDVPAFLA